MVRIGWRRVHPGLVLIPLSTAMLLLTAAAGPEAYDRIRATGNADAGGGRCHWLDDIQAKYEVSLVDSLGSQGELVAPDPHRAGRGTVWR